MKKNLLGDESCCLHIFMRKEIKPFFYINDGTCTEQKHTLGAACSPRGQQWGGRLSLDDDTFFPKAKQRMT